MYLLLESNLNWRSILPFKSNKATIRVLYICLFIYFINIKDLVFLKFIWFGKHRSNELNNASKEKFVTTDLSLAQIIQKQHRGLGEIPRSYINCQIGWHLHLWGWYPRLENPGSATALACHIHSWCWSMHIWVVLMHNFRILRPCHWQKS